MKKSPAEIIYYSVTTVFSILVALLFFFFYKYHILYIEGSQLFIYTKEYFTETVLTPGGFGEYIGRFLIQFYKFPILGAIIISLSLLYLQSGIVAIFKSIKIKPALLPLSLIPSAFYCVHLCQESFTLTGVIALSAAVYAAVTYTKIANTTLRSIYGAISIFAVYLLFGGTVVVTLAIMIMLELILKDKRKILPIILSLLSMVALIFTAKYIAPQLRTDLLMTGGIYFRYSTIPFKYFIIIYLTVLLTIGLYAALPSLQKWFTSSIISAITLSVFAVCMSGQLKGNRDSTLFYLFAARNFEWSTIIDYSRKHPLDSYYSANITNLALAKKDLAGDLFFTFDQPDKDPFILNFNTDMLYGGEILFNLGFINESQRYAFESMVSSPDRQKGALFITRLAETNMIAGRNEVAKVYLHTLQRTLFYRNWANRRLELINRPEGLEGTYYGEIAKLQPKREFYFMTSDFEKVLKDSYDENPDNLVLYNYLMMSYLYNKNGKDFCINYLNYRQPVPVHYQEALLLFCSLSGKQIEDLSISFEQKQIDRYQQFKEILKANNSNMLSKYFSNTYYYFYYTSK